MNHSAILDALSREMVRAEREREPLALLMADLDHFKRINDTYGHRVGDIVIREVANRIRYAITSDPIGSQAGPLSVTVSIGAATWSFGQSPLPHLLWETADQALYHVKHNGRNGVAVASLPHNLSYRKVA